MGVGSGLEEAVDDADGGFAVDDADDFPGELPALGLVAVGVEDVPLDGLEHGGVVAGLFAYVPEVEVGGVEAAADASGEEAVEGAVVKESIDDDGFVEAGKFKDGTGDVGNEEVSGVEEGDEVGFIEAGEVDVGGLGPGEHAAEVATVTPAEEDVGVGFEDEVVVGEVGGEVFAEAEDGGGVEGGGVEDGGFVGVEVAIEEELSAVGVGEAEVGVELGVAGDAEAVGVCGEMLREGVVHEGAVDEADVDTVEDGVEVDGFAAPGAVHDEGGAVEGDVEGMGVVAKDEPPAMAVFFLEGVGEAAGLGVLDGLGALVHLVAGAGGGNDEGVGDISPREFVDDGFEMGSVV